MATPEEWRIVPGYTRYSVSNLGRAKNTRTDRILKQSRARKGYLAVGLVPDNVRNQHTTFVIHRLIAQAFVENPEGKPYVDHINRETMDNRAANLRWATEQENCINTGISRRNTSGYKGVYWNTASNKWMAYIRKDNKMKYLGIFDDPAEASAYRDTVGKELFGDWYKTTEDSLMEMIEEL